MRLCERPCLDMSTGSLPAATPGRLEQGAAAGLVPGHAAGPAVRHPGRQWAAAGRVSAFALTFSCVRFMFYTYMCVCVLSVCVCMRAVSTCVYACCQSVCVCVLSVHVCMRAVSLCVYACCQSVCVCTCMCRHVVLGFSRCGQLLLSYRSELDVTATLSTYTLHWWLFLGHSPLQHVRICSAMPIGEGWADPSSL